MSRREGVRVSSRFQCFVQDQLHIAANSSLAWLAKIEQLFIVMSEQESVAFKGNRHAYQSESRIANNVYSTI